MSFLDLAQNKKKKARKTENDCTLVFISIINFKFLVLKFHIVHYAFSSNLLVSYFERR